MIIKTIERSASREYNILGLKEWKGARMVAEINETEDEYECGKELERKVERQLDSNRELTDASTIKWDWHEEPYLKPPYGNIPVEQVSKPIGTVDALIADINSCESVKVLESYSLLVKKSPWLQEAYDRKMDELMSTAFKKNDKINNNERDKI